MLNVIIDVVLLLILLGCAWKGYRSGLISGVFAILALVVAVYGADLVADTYSGEFTSVVEPFASGLVDRASSAAWDEFDAQGVTPDVYTEAYETLRGVGFMRSAAENIAREVSSGVTEGGHILKVAMVDLLCVKVAYVLTVAVFFILIAIIFAVIGNIINLEFRLPGLELINGMLGTVFGIVRGLIICFALAWLLRFTGMAVKESVVDNTLLLNWLMEANPLVGLLGL